MHATDQLFFTFNIEPTPQLRPRASARDDSQIVKMVSEKRYGETGKIIISVKTV